MSGGLEGLLAGRTLVKRYEIGEVIGRGGFAVVYEAMDLRLGRPVAVKVITVAPHDEEARAALRERFHREARSAAGLPHHPNLVAVHDVGTDPELGIDFLVMERLRGVNLSQHLRAAGRLPVPEALAILRAAAEGIAIGHREGLVHRDVKPGNLFIAESHGDGPTSRRVCVLDYGIAKAMEDDATLTRADAAPFSPAFASPEQLRGEREIGPSSDVFSLGVVGYELLTGERPFSAGPGQPPTGWELRGGIRDANPDVSPAVEAVLLRAMSVEPATRYADADAFARALDEAAHAPAGVDDDRTMLAPVPVAVPAAAPPEPRPGATARRRVGATPVVLFIALAMVAVAAWAALGGRGGVTAVDDRAATDSIVADTGVDARPTEEWPVEARPPAAAAVEPVQPVGEQPRSPAPMPTDPTPPPADGTPIPPPAAPAREPAPPPPAREPEPAPREPAPREPAQREPAPRQPIPPPADQPVRPPAPPPVVLPPPSPAPADTIRIGVPR